MWPGAAMLVEAARRWLTYRPGWGLPCGMMDQTRYLGYWSTRGEASSPPPIVCLCTFRFSESSKMYFHTPVMTRSSPGYEVAGCEYSRFVQDSFRIGELVNLGFGIGGRFTVTHDSDDAGRVRSRTDFRFNQVPTHPPSRRPRQRRCECPGFDRTWRSGTAEGEQAGGSREDPSPSHTQATNKSARWALVSPCEQGGAGATKRGEVGPGEALS